MKVRNAVGAEGLTLRARSALAPLGKEGDGAGQDGSKLYDFLLIEDHPLYAEGFRAALRRTFPEAELTTLENGQQALGLMASQPFDLVFLDVQLPDINGLHLLQVLQQRRIWQPVVILTGTVDSLVVERARRGGALGVLSKRLDDASLKQHCQQVLDGEAVFEQVAPAASSALQGADRLTSRELDVLFKLAEGLENTQICQVLGMSDSTLRTHLRALFQKMQVCNRTACVVKAIRLGMI